jgi:glycerol-3-phosphate dehydrogenase
MTEVNRTEYDLAIIGGGINGCGIARDAAGRGLKVLLVEKNDIASHTSSWSSKLIHGGLRYLEQYEFRLVRESLKEREVLKRIAPHITRPLSFVLPYDDHMRPAWMLRVGLWIYDHLGWSRAAPMSLPKSRSVRIPQDGYGYALDARFTRGFVYSDLQVDDARLTLLNAIGARDKGATVLTRTICTKAQRINDGNLWQLELRCADDQVQTIHAKVLINAAGPWVKQVLDEVICEPSRERVKLVRGSHIVLPRLHDSPHAFILQNSDNRVVFVIPFAGDFSLIGTTDVAINALSESERVSDSEVDYLITVVNRYFKAAVRSSDVVWKYAGTRPLYDDGGANPSKVTRDYVLKLSGESGAPLLSIFGGKITTYRELALHALEKLTPHLPQARPAWTHTEPLPGGDIESVAALETKLTKRYPQIKESILFALARRHGSRCEALLTQCRGDLGEYIGATLTQREVEYMVQQEWVCNADDVMWRRSKAGLKLDAVQTQRLTAIVASALDDAHKVGKLA